MAHEDARSWHGGYGGTTCAFTLLISLGTEAATAIPRGTVQLCVFSLHAGTRVIRMFNVFAYAPSGAALIAR
eukprot:4636235-Pyramimonas_sp.AAC.1